VELEYKTSKFENVKDEMLRLLRDHFEEISPFSSKHKFEPDVDYFEAVESAGALRIFTVHDGKNLVGYNAFLIHRHGHINAMVGNQEVIYLKPEYRSKGIGAKLVQLSEMILKANGCKYIICTSNAHQDYGSVFEKAGYVELDRNFVKEL
jgi:GNAT superfamily N-acetyltransferase